MDCDGVASAGLLHFSRQTAAAAFLNVFRGMWVRSTKKVQPVLGGFESANYHTERLWATAPDGVRVPVSLVYHKRLAKLDGSDPLLLDGCTASSLCPCP